tara:strand:- start:302 stop:568 length:267 start_codon:yes stop_codon:yes gene_type:complete
MKKFGFNVLVVTTKMIRSHILDAEFNVKFPYKSFPWRLDLGNTVCHFECKAHMEKYLSRYKFKPKDVNISNRNGEKFVFKQKRKKRST